MNYCNITLDNPVQEGFINVYVVQRNLLNGVRMNEVKIQESEPVTFSFNEDGYYTICTLAVSTNPAKKYYYKEGKFYKGIYEVPLLEVLDNENPTYKPYFHLCNLKHCYLDACLDIFDSNSIKCDSRPNTYKRDLIWTTLNAIEYMVEFGQYYEAERLLNRVVRCNGICDTNTNTSCGCELMRM